MNDKEIGAMCRKAGLGLAGWCDVTRLLAQMGGPPSPGCIRWLKRRYGVEWHLAEHDSDPAQLSTLISYWRTKSELKPGDYFRAAGVEGIVTDIDPDVEPEYTEAAIAAYDAMRARLRHEAAEKRLRACPCREHVRLEDENTSLREEAIVW